MDITHFERRFVALDRVFSRLSPQARAVFLLHFRDGCTIGEIAGRLWMQRAMVQKDLAKAILQWRREIASRGQESPMSIQVESEAANWLAEIQTGESSSRARERLSGWRSSEPLYSTPCWLRASREHARAYVEQRELWEVARRYDSARTLDVESLLAAARPEARVIPIMRPRSTQPRGASVAMREYRARANSGRLPRVATAALAVVILAGLLGGSLYPAGPQECSTGIGEQRTVTLPDGSSVRLDGDSRIRVQFSGHDRRIDLLKGQALFKVAKNAERPFVVVSGGTRIRDVGTRFNVNRMRSETVVTVLEGRVAVTCPRSSNAVPPSAPAISSPIEVGAGEQVAVMPDVIPRPRPARLAAATAWTHNMLIFDPTPLGQAAEEFNRFSTRQLVIDGMQLQNLPVYGVFNALDPASLPRFVRFLRVLPGIRIIEAGDRIIVTQARHLRSLLHRPAVADHERLAGERGGLE